MSGDSKDTIQLSTQNRNFLTAESGSRWQKICEQHPQTAESINAQVRQYLSDACLLSPFIGRVLERELPFFVQRIDDQGLTENFDYAAIKSDLEQELKSVTNDAAAKLSLRRWRTRWFGLIAIRGLISNISIEQEFRDISHISDALILAAYEWLYPAMCQQWGRPETEAKTSMPLLIVAMGKYGGFELNFSSDVDLIFYFPEDGETKGGRRNLEHQTFFTRLGQRLIDLLADVTRDGFVFRVDMRLRPYGDSGPLAMSFDAAEDYYQEQGREWERFAMIKARVINPESEFSHSFAKMIQPFVYRRYIDFGVLESIRSLKSKIETEVRRKGLDDNIKLGSGGIREAEFIVQSLQLVRGGRMRNLQQRSFVEALRQLEQLKMVEPKVATELLEAYKFLRKVEHVLQQINDAQTQRLPEGDIDKVRLSSAMRFASYPTFHQKLEHHRQVIAREFTLLFRSEEEQQDTKESFNLELIEKEDFVRWYQDHESEEVDAILQRLGKFASSNHFQQLSSRGKNRLESLFPKLLKALSEEEKPSVTLERVLSLLRSVTRRTAYLVLLEENPPVLEHLIKLCGQSKWVSEQLSQFPLLLDELLYPAGLYQPLMTSDLRLELRQQMLRIEPDDEEQQQEQLRIFKQTHELRVAAAVLNNTIDVKNASRYLSQIAQAILESVLNLSWRKLCSRYGVPSVENASPDQLSGFAVIAYGKFGGEELGFGSDLDLVFLFNAEPEGLTQGNKSISHNQFYTRLAQRVINTLNIRTLSGVLYEVDMRLRPSGSSGLLVSYTEAFEEYQWNEAWTWEHQALTRARVVAGDKQLKNWFAKFRLKVITRERDKAKIKCDVVEMRQKMRQSLDKSNQEKLDFKQCPGGMVDIEFIAQYLLLTHGASYPDEVWCSRTTRQFDRLAELGVIDSQLAERLIEAYRFYRRLNNRLVLTGQKKLVRQKTIARQQAQVIACWERFFPDQSNCEEGDV